MDALTQAMLLARRFEGFYSSPYLCPAGVPTIGYGSTHYEGGTAVQLTDPPIARERAEQLLRWEIERQCAPAVRRLCPAAALPGRQAALIDFAYNLGTGRLKTSTLRRLVNAGRWAQVPAELAKWNKGGGRVLPGLTRRRAAEAALI